MAIKARNRFRKLLNRLRPRRTARLRCSIIRLAAKPKLKVYERKQLRHLQSLLGNANPYPIYGVARNLRAIRLANRAIAELHDHASSDCHATRGAAQSRDDDATRRA